MVSLIGARVALVLILIVAVFCLAPPLAAQTQSVPVPGAPGQAPNQPSPTSTQPAQLPAPGQPAAEGATVFAANCAVCHGPDGKGTASGPSLEAASDPAFVMQTVQSGRGAMPSFAGRLSDAQISAVADYVSGTIATVQLTGGDLSRGGVIYRLQCGGCHGATARGGALVETGVNAPALTGLAPAVIAGAIRSGPGAMPIFPQSAISQQDLASVVAYVQMMQQPENPGGLSLGFRGPVTEGLAALGVLGVLVLLAVWVEWRGRG